MKQNIMYYVVDPIAEGIIGSFSAISDAMACKVIEESFLKIEKNKDKVNWYRLYKGPSLFDVCEMYSEVVDSCEDYGFLSENAGWVFDSEEQKDGN